MTYFFFEKFSICQLGNITRRSGPEPNPTLNRQKELITCDYRGAVIPGKL
jgi:hypothetical protein